MPPRILFIVWGDRSYQPGVKVHVDLAAAVRREGVEASAAVFHGGPDSREAARRAVGEDRVRDCRTEAEVVAAARAFGAEYAFCKDHIESLHLLQRLQREAGTRSIAITSGFAALEALRPPLPVGPGRPQVRHRSTGRRSVPWGILTRRYRALLGDVDAVVANSMYSEMLLDLLFHRRCHGVLYPIVDPAVYAPPAAPAPPRSGTLAFVGPAGNRPVEEFAPMLDRLRRDAPPLHLFGASDTQQGVVDRLGEEGILRHENIPDRELVRLYQGARVTYVTSEWEGFGYVGPESLLCGTPVVTEIAQPWLEITGPSPVARVARTPSDLAQALLHPPDGRATTGLEEAQRRLAATLAPKAGAARLLRVLELLAGG